MTLKNECVLDENEVVEIMSNYLRNKGYSIEKSATTRQKGIDIIAFKEEEKLYIEAKGATSSKKESKNYGQLFSSSQVTSHIGRAVVAALKVVDLGNEHIVSAIALPDTEIHKRKIDEIQPPLKCLGIKVFFVSSQKVVDYFDE